MSEHLRSDQFIALASSPPDDPGRVEAEAHMAQCEACRAQWREHEAMFSMLDASFELPEIPAALAARVHVSLYPRRWPRLVLMGTWLLSLVLALFPNDGGDQLAVAIGEHCAAMEFAFAAAPLGIATWMSRAGKLRIDAASFALIGSSAGLVGQWWLRAACPVHGAVYHVFVFHFLAVLAVSLLGGAIGLRFVADRA